MKLVKKPAALPLKIGDEEDLRKSDWRALTTT
jgi:hypothetical protein